MRTDQRIAEYLRSRGVASPPVDLVDSVMAAVDAAPEPRSWFRANVPVLAAAGAAAVVVAVALLLGPFRDIGPAPAPTGTPAPTATGDEPTIDDLREALADAVEVLRTAPGVEGRQIADRDGVIGTATWFDWRPDGDAVVVQREDLDVTQTGWWIVPGAEPPTSGQRVRTLIWMTVADQFFFGTVEGWQVGDRDDAPYVVAYGPGILDGVIDPWQPLEGLVQRLPSPSAARVTRDDLPDSRVEWTLESDWRDGVAIQRWSIGSAGELRSWTWRLEGVSVDVEGGFNANATHASLEYTITAGDPIGAPDLHAPVDAAAVGLPADFPLEPAPVSLDDVEQVETCEHPSGRYRVTLPDGWWTNRDGGRDALWEACELFGPEPFPVTPDADRTWPSGVALTISWIDGGCVGSFLALLSSEEASVDGLPAGVAEYAWGTSSDDPPGLYEYVINLSAPGVDCEVGGRFITAATSVEMAGDYEENKSFLDQIMDGMEITPP